MTLIRNLAVALIALSFAGFAAAQQQDQVSQLAQMVGLSDEQQSEIRGIIEETGTVQSFQQQTTGARMVVAASKILDDLEVGGSIAVNSISHSHSARQTSASTKLLIMSAGTPRSRKTSSKSGR